MAEPGTLAGEKLDVLVMLVEAYEKSITHLIYPIQLQRLSSRWNKKA